MSSDVHGETRQRTERAPITNWRAGPVGECDGGDAHGVISVHVIVRCFCGAAWMSTDATVAFTEAFVHEHPPGSPVPRDSDVGGGLEGW